MGFFSAQASGDTDDDVGVIIAEFAAHGLAYCGFGVEAISIYGAGDGDQVVFINVGFFGKLSGDGCGDADDAVEEGAVLPAVEEVVCYGEDVVFAADGDGALIFWDEGDCFGVGPGVAAAVEVDDVWLVFFDDAMKGAGIIDDAEAEAADVVYGVIDGEAGFAAVLGEFAFGGYAEEDVPVEVF